MRQLIDLDQGIAIGQRAGHGHSGGLAGAD
jgi:hypothetical protein